MTGDKPTKPSPKGDAKPPERTSSRMRVPVLPLRETVMFPGVTAPIGAGRPATLRAIEAALKEETKLIFAVAQRENVEQAQPEVLYTTGTVARIGQVQRGLGGIQLLLHGEYRATVLQYSETESGFFEAVVQEAPDLPPLDREDAAFVALHKEVRERAAELGLRMGLPEEVVKQVLEGVPVKVFPVPEGVVFTKIDAETGLLPIPESEKTVFVCFKEGTVPTDFTKPPGEVTEEDDFFKKDL